MDHSQHVASVQAAQMEPTLAGSLGEFFSQNGFMPHGHCYLWKPALVWTHVISDFLIGTAYVAISLTLYFIVRRVRLQFSTVMLSFGLFIAACGATHFMEIWNLWNADYWAGGWVKVLTAVASVATAIYLVRLRPQLYAVAAAAKLSEQRRLDLETLTKDLEDRVAERTQELNTSRLEALAQKEQLQALTDALPSLIYSVNENHSYQMVNTAYAKAWALEKKDMIGRPMVAVLGEESYNRIRPFLQKAFAGEASEYEGELELPRDGLRYIAASYRPLKGPSGKIESVIALVHDLTERRAAYEALRKNEIELAEAKTRAEEASEAKSAFLANMSHEVRTPLGAMLGFAQLMTEDPSNTPEQQNNLRTIVRNGEQLFRIINEILDISKVEANKIEVDRTRFDLSECISDVTSLLALKAREKGLGFEVKSRGPLPETIVSDFTRFRQILMNVIGNAIKFTDVGHVHVTFQLKDKGLTNENPCLEMTVEDTGPGIPEDKKGRLFQPFTQADTSTSRKFGGTGLGLYLSKRLAQALGGDLELTRSKEGQGCTFVARIDAGPLENKPFLSFDHPSRTHLVPGDFPKFPTDKLGGVKVLVIDDSPDNLQLTSRFLEASGANVEIANGAEAGIKFLNEKEVDVVVMDIQMPGLDGYQAVRRLRQQGYEKPVVALTAHAMKGEKERCLEAGFDGYLVKPINRPALVQEVRSQVDRSMT